MAVIGVAARAPREQKQRKENDMDRLFKALQIANTGLGIAVNYDKFMNEPERIKASQEAAAAARVEEQDKDLAFKREQEAEKKRQFGITEKRLGKEADAKRRDAEVVIPEGATPGTKEIMTIVPKKHHAQALKEQGFLQDHDNTVTLISGIFDDMKEINVIEGNIPFTQDKARADAAQGTIMSSLQSVWKGVMSDKDREDLMGLVPTPSDTEAQIAIKQKEMLRILNTNRKATPILDGFGITKETGKKLTQKEKDRKTLETVVGSPVDDAMEAAMLKALGSGQFDNVGKK
jgi:hypothetical protein